MSSSPRSRPVAAITAFVAGRVPVLLVALASCLVEPRSASAATLHPLFTSGVVLQQGVKVRIFGSADDGEPVTVRIQNAEASTVGEGGKWSVEIGPLSAGSANVLQVTGTRTLTVNDVSVGEVWLCAGDANMQVQTLHTTNSVQAMTAPENRHLRFFTVRRNAAVDPQPITNLSYWTPAGAGSVGVFSAVGYHFGRELYKELETPIGLISCNHFQATCDSLISRDAIEKADALKPELTARPPSDRNAGTPTVLYNGMVDDLRKFVVAGVIYYQGENDWDRAFEHRIALPTLIADWREKFGNSELPFLFVQAAPYRQGGFRTGESRLAVLRESQMLTWKQTKRTAMVVLTDSGNAYDLHPREKQVVGKRLAVAARAVAYGQNVVYSGPRYAAVKFDSGHATLSFDFVGEGLAFDGEKITGFTIAGQDGVFKPAEAKIEGDKIVVKSAEVPVPTAVRYGWSDLAECNLRNREGYPASPFRTDVPASQPAAAPANGK
jgi:sialate O-acetylesterase